MSRVLAHPRSETRVRVGSSAFGQAFRSERPSGGGLETEASALVGEVGQNQKVGAVLPWPGLSVGDSIAPLACHLGTWAGS